jgi:hypothetical protein
VPLTDCGICGIGGATKLSEPPPPPLEPPPFGTGVSIIFLTAANPATPVAIA